jgi:penicillin-binding protein 2
MDTRKKIQLSFFIIAGIFMVICLRLMQLQVLEGDKYRRLSEGNRLKIMSTPAPRGIILDRNGTPLVKNVPMYSVYIMYDPAKSVDIETLSSVVGVEKQEIEAKLHRKDNSPFVPIELKHSLSFQEIARLEARRSDFPGLFIQTDAGRAYPFGKVGAHIIGYLGKMTPSQSESPEFLNLPPDTLIGQWGVEALYDSQLRGVAGGKVI